MRFSKKYLAFALVLALCLIWKLNTWNDQYALVETFRGAELKQEVFYPLMSKNINDSGQINVYINGEKFANNSQNVIFDNNLQPVCSLEFIRDILKGSAYQEDEKTAVLQVSDDIYEFLVNNSTATLNGDDYELLLMPSVLNSDFFIGVEDVCNIFGYKYSFDSESYDIYIDIENYPVLPSSYDLRDIGRVSKIRNQGSTSTCWACASIEALESALLPLKQYSFSVDSMIEENSFKLDESAGGDYTMALAYLLSWQGPVSNDDSVSSILSDLSGNKNYPAAVHLQEVNFYDSEDIGDIKWAVYRYGGVSTSIYANVSTSNLEGAACYNKRTNSYCFTGTNKPNHDVVIIGWDDDYPASSFVDGAPGNGAFICQNSWGDDFGDNGVFYISYYDTNIGNQAVSYVDVDTTNKYSYLYQSDLCGWVGQVGYSKEWLYGANIFTATADQQIEAAGFYALGDNSTYEVYFVPDYENTSSLAKRNLVASGSLEKAGYYTIQFDTAYSVSEGEKFAVVVYIDTPGMKRPMAIEYAADGMTEAVDLSDGLGFISNNGLDWENAIDVANANLCIKAYGNELVNVYE